MAQRQAHLSVTPPLGRRLTALTATVSLVASIAVLAVAVPKGVSDTTSDDASEPPATTMVPAKGNVRGLTSAVDEQDRTMPAIPLGHDCWLVSTADLDGLTPQWITASDGTRIEVDTLGVVHDAELAVVKATSNKGLEADVAFDALVMDDDDYTRYKVIDIATQDMFSLERSLSLNVDSKDIPITTPAPVRHIAAVVDDLERIVGIVVRRGYATWMLGKDSLAGILSMVVPD